jgi:hypothetical protein
MVVQGRCVAALSAAAGARGARTCRAMLRLLVPRCAQHSIQNIQTGAIPPYGCFKIIPAAALLQAVDGAAGLDVGQCVCGLGSNCCCLSLCRSSPQTTLSKTPNTDMCPLTPPVPRRSASLDQVHVAEGMHESNLLHGSDVTLLTRRGDKIKGILLGSSAASRAVAHHVR